MDKEHLCKTTMPVQNSGYEYELPTTADGKICKPSRKNFERLCRQLADEIQITQAKLAGNKAMLNDLFARLDKLKEEKTAKFTEKGSVEACVNNMSVNINKLSEKIGQLQSKLQYRDLQKLDNAIRKLQVHLDSRHFKHCEEKKIVAEIDKLNRSRKVVGEYLGTQSELKALRSSQHDKRAARDRVIKEIVAIRKQEEDTREKLTTCKALESQLREEMELKNNQKQSLKEQFTKHQQTYAEQKAAAKQVDLDNKQKQQQQLNWLPHHNQTRCLGLAEKVADKQQTAEMLTCQQLIEFCQRLTKQIGDDRSSQRQKKKKISYTPDQLSKFVSIDICPPMTVAQARECIPILEQKLVNLQTDIPVRVTLTEISQSNDYSENSQYNGTVSTEGTDVNLEPSSQSSNNMQELESEQPDDQSDKASLSKQISNTSDEDTLDSITYKLSVLEGLCHIEDIKTKDNCIA